MDSRRRSGTTVDGTLGREKLLGARQTAGQGQGERDDLWHDQAAAGGRWQGLCRDPAAVAEPITLLGAASSLDKVRGQTVMA